MNDLQTPGRKRNCEMAHLWVFMSTRKCGWRLAFHSSEMGPQVSMNHFNEKPRRVQFLYQFVSVIGHLDSFPTWRNRIFYNRKCVVFLSLGVHSDQLQLGVQYCRYRPEALRLKGSSTHCTCTRELKSLDSDRHKCRSSSLLCFSASSVHAWKQSRFPWIGHRACQRASAPADPVHRKRLPTVLSAFTLSNQMCDHISGLGSC